MRKPLVAVSGKNGQLGSELKDLSVSFPAFDFVFAGKADLDLVDPGSLRSFFEKYHPDFFINCAAYTAVDKAEQDQETALRVNAEAVGELALLSERNRCALIHLSTDYVFNGEGSHPYRTEDPTDPVNYYGYTKLLGEQLALGNCRRTLVIRTSWVYSTHGNNFVKTMLRLMQERENLNIVADQTGSPTYARDLAEAILEILSRLEENPVFPSGIYHFSNAGVISWYEFALAIRQTQGVSCQLHPIRTEQYPTPARRPRYSVMDNQKIVDIFGIVPRPWENSLQECLKQMNP